MGIATRANHANSGGPIHGVTARAVSPLLSPSRFNPSFLPYSPYSNARFQSPSTPKSAKQVGQISQRTSPASPHFAGIRSPHTIYTGSAASSPFDRSMRTPGMPSLIPSKRLEDDEPRTPSRQTTQELNEDLLLHGYVTRATQDRRQRIKHQRQLARQKKAEEQQRIAAKDIDHDKLLDPEYHKKIKTTKRVGHTLAITIASIDGVVTGVAVGSIAFLASGGLALAIVIGLCGFLVNRVVYWRSVPDMLRQLFVDGFFSDLTFKKKAAIFCSLIFASTLGAGFAALAFKSMCSIIGLSMATAFVVNPVIAIIITFLALCYFVANTSLFFFSLSKLIRKDAEGRELWERIRDFFKGLVKADPDKHPIEQKLATFFQIVFSLAGLALGVTAAIAILGKLNVSITELLTSTANMAKETAAIVAKVIVFGLAIVARLAFSLQSAIQGLGKIGKGFGSMLFAIGWSLGHWSTAKENMANGWHAWKARQNESMKGQSWQDSWKLWHKVSSNADKLNDDNNSKLGYYWGGFKYAFSHLPAIKKAAWFFGGLWFVIHIPAILVNAIGVLSLGAGGGPHLHAFTNGIGIPITPEGAKLEAMIAAGSFSAILGTYKYLDLKTNENDGSRKHPENKGRVRRAYMGERAPGEWRGRMGATPETEPLLDNARDQDSPRKEIFTSEHYRPSAKRRLRFGDGLESATNTPARPASAPPIMNNDYLQAGDLTPKFA